MAIRSALLQITALSGAQLNIKPYSGSRFKLNPTPIFPFMPVRIVIMKSLIKVPLDLVSQSTTRFSQYL